LGGNFPSGKNPVDKGKKGEKQMWGQGLIKEERAPKCPKREINGGKI